MNITENIVVVGKPDTCLPPVEGKSWWEVTPRELFTVTAEVLFKDAKASMDDWRLQLNRDRW